MHPLPEQRAAISSFPAMLQKRSKQYHIRESLNTVTQLEVCVVRRTLFEAVVFVPHRVVEIEHVVVEASASNCDRVALSKLLVPTANIMQWLTADWREQQQRCAGGRRVRWARCVPLRLPNEVQQHVNDHHRGRCAATALVTIADHFDHTQPFPVQITKLARNLVETRLHWSLRVVHGPPEEIDLRGRPRAAHLVERLLHSEHLLEWQPRGRTRVALLMNQHAAAIPRPLLEHLALQDHLERLGVAGITIGEFAMLSRVSAPLQTPRSAVQI